MGKASIHSAVPVIATDDVQASVEYFVRTLGFDADFVWGDPPVYAGVTSGEVEIYFAKDPATAAAIRQHALAPDLFLWVRGIAALYAQHTAAGATIAEPLTDKPWGARQYVLRDPNGYHLKFAEPLPAPPTP